METREAIRRGVIALGSAYPLKRGYTTLAHAGPVRRLFHDAGPRRARLRTGDHLWVDPDDYIGRMALLFGDYDPKITWVCAQTLRPGDTVIDIGANIGVVTAFAAAEVGPSGHVHSFEPQEDLAAALERSMTESGRSNVTVHPIALSDEDGERTLYGDASVRAEVSLERGEPGSEIGTCVTRDSNAYLDALGLPAIRMLKIDVEGHEEHILRSAARYLADNRPDILVFESHGATPFFERPVVTLLADLDYRFFRLPRAYSRRMTLTEVGADTPMDPSIYDFVAVAPGAGWPSPALVG